MICEKCGKEIEEATIGMGMNVGFGPAYWCKECTPPATIVYIMEQIELVINPPQELP